MTSLFNELQVLLHDQRFVNVWDHTATGDCCFDQGVQLLIASDSELQMARRYALDLEVFASVSSQFQNFSS